MCVLRSRNECTDRDRLRDIHVTITDGFVCLVLSNLTAVPRNPFLIKSRKQQARPFPRRKDQISCIPVYDPSARLQNGQLGHIEYVIEAECESSLTVILHHS